MPSDGRLGGSGQDGGDDASETLSIDPGPAAAPGLRPGQRVVLVAAVARNGVIGVDGTMPWHLPEDFAHFKQTTMGHTLLMGRATFDSIGRPLPGRTTVVMTRDAAWSADGTIAARSLTEAFAEAGRLPGDVMVVGGAQIYALALPFATHQVLTEVPLDVVGDTSYPSWDPTRWRETARVVGERCDWVWWARVAPEVEQG